MGRWIDIDRVIGIVFPLLVSISVCVPGNWVRYGVRELRVY